MDWFALEVGKIEEETINFINESFKKLRSAEAAFDLFQKFKNIRSRKSINEQMMKRFNDILVQFTREVSVSVILIKIYFQTRECEYVTYCLCSTCNLEGHHYPCNEKFSV